MYTNVFTILFDHWHLYFVTILDFLFRSHDYVNIPVGTEDPGHMTNGHDKSETSSHIYSPVAEDQVPDDVTHDHNAGVLVRI